MSDPDVEPCPFCRGDLPDDLVGKIRSAEPGKPMTLDEAKAWLREIGWNWKGRMSWNGGGNGRLLIQ